MPKNSFGIRGIEEILQNRRSGNLVEKVVINSQGYDNPWSLPPSAKLLGLFGQIPLVHQINPFVSFDVVLLALIKMAGAAQQFKLQS